MDTWDSATNIAVQKAVNKLEDEMTPKEHELVQNRIKEAEKCINDTRELLAYFSSITAKIN